jgi:hypothetical protein
LHIGAKLFGDARQTRKKSLILDAERHRYDEVLSDISGQDIEAHAENVDQMIACVHNWLSDNRAAGAAPILGAKTIQKYYMRFKIEVVTLLKSHRMDPLGRLTHSDYAPKKISAA